MSKPITKAIITTAGFGTRFLPISKTIQKEMLPVLNRPVVDYLVEDLIAAGVTEIIFVINEHNRQIRHYYSENTRLEEYLTNKPNQSGLAALREISDLHRKAKFTFVKQSDQDQYGTAVPVRLCRELLEKEVAFFVFMGDDFLHNSRGQSEAAGMAKLFSQNQVGGVMTCVPQPEKLLHKYGIAEIETQGGVSFLQRLVEKPAPGTAPSNLANISKFILTPEIFDIVDQQQPDSRSGELLITDSVEELARRAKVAVYTPIGEYLDGGFVESWLKANLRVAWDQPELRAALSAYVEKLNAET